ncbi:MAG: septum formation initiator family protein [Bacteroidota bacterium]
MWSRILKIVKNRYLLASLGFLAFIGFFDQNNIINQYKLHQDLKELQREKQYYIQEIKKDKKTTQELKTNLRNLETFGREKYLMKKDDEDIFVIYKEADHQ